jgi:iron(III) transport system permease protein
VTDLFQIRTFAEEIYVQTAGGAIWDLSGTPASGPLASRPSSRSFFLGTLLLLAAFMFVIWISFRAVGSSYRASSERKWTIHTGRGGWILSACLVIALVALCGIPLGSLFYQAGIQIERRESVYIWSWSVAKALSTVAHAPALHRNELVATGIVATAAATAATLVAALLGVWAASRGWGYAVAAIIASILASIPGPLLGLWIIRALNQPPGSPLSFLAILYDEAAFGFAPWLAQTLRVLPFAVIVLVPALGCTPRALLDAASLDGAGLWRKVAHVFLPLHWRAIIVGWLVAFVLACGELSATVLVAPPGVTPLAVRMFNLVHYGVDDQLAGLALFVWATVLVITGAVFLFAGRSGQEKV